MNKEIQTRLKKFENMYPEGSPIRDAIKVARLTIMDLEEEVQRLTAEIEKVPEDSK